jgi:hypothetical protein
MNERIQQLAEQAGLRFTQLMSNPMVPVVDGKETDLEKFAELIVQECVMFIDTGADKFSDGEWLKTSVKDIGAMIKQHFGVENGIR